MKKIALGIIIGILLATAIPAAAEELTKKVTATVRGDFIVELDGKEITLPKPPLVYDGTAHLPLRVLGEIFGKNVDFKDGVIQLSTPEDVGLKLTKEEYDSKIGILEGEIVTKKWQLNTAKEYIQNVDNGKIEKDEAEYNSTKEIIASIEETLQNLEKQISDLKTEYPHYA